MGKSYSVNGYINAILRRTATKTLLVEGVTDIALLNRLLAEKPTQKSKAPAIDSASIFNDVATNDLGNKEKIIHFKNKIEPLVPTFSKLETIFATLVDREWDGLHFEGIGLHGAWTPPEQGRAHFVTTGHSIENYCFDSSFVIDYLKYSFPSSVSVELLELLNESFHAILAFGMSYSIVARDLSCLKRCIGLLKLEHVSIENDSFNLNDSFERALSDRGFARSGEFRTNANNSAKEFWSRNPRNEPVNWLLHGHLGLEAIWTCVGHLAKSLAVSDDIVTQIVSGRQMEKDRFMNDWITKHLQSERRSPLDDVVEWMLTAPHVC